MPADLAQKSLEIKSSLNQFSNAKSTTNLENFPLNESVSELNATAANMVTNLPALNTTFHANAEYTVNIINDNARVTNSPILAGDLGDFGQQEPDAANNLIETQTGYNRKISLLHFRNFTQTR